MAHDQQDNRTPDEIAEDTELESSSHSSPAYSGRGRRNPFNAGNKGLPNLDDYDVMRRVVDANDGLMGSRIVGPRSYRGRKMPTWAMDDKKVQHLLLSTFPRMKEDSAAGRRQRDSAARWHAVIHLYFRMKYTCSQIAEELGSSHCKIKNVIRSIQRVVRGLRADSRKPRTNTRGANLRGTQHPRKSKS